MLACDERATSSSRGSPVLSVEMDLQRGSGMAAHVVTRVGQELRALGPVGGARAFEVEGVRQHEGPVLEDGLVGGPVEDRRRDGGSVEADHHGATGDDRSADAVLRAGISRHGRQTQPSRRDGIMAASFP